MTLDRPGTADPAEGARQETPPATPAEDPDRPGGGAGPDDRISAFAGRAPGYSHHL
ncbi:hypothetical protein [Solihabitans fulvus]|uniref:hypothetical protein n=1 Tax=Solihabitans fulvus TaxID=1892852 RepID=UPI001661C21B|nr:hypothetical protein [Solihabitans fulvus]